MSGWDLAVRALAAGGTYFLSASAFSLVYESRRGGLFHLAQGGLMLAAVTVYSHYVWLGVRQELACLAGVTAGGLVGIAIELGVYSRLRTRGATGATFMLASFGLLLVEERLVLILRGVSPLSLPSQTSIAERTSYLGADLLPAEVVAIQASIGLAVVLAILHAGAPGRAFAALRESPLMYSWRVGREDIARSVVSLLAGATGGLAAILTLCRHPIQTEGAAMRLLLPAFLVALLARSLTAQALLRLRPSWRIAWVERASLVVATWGIAYSLAATEFTIDLMWRPQWKETAVLVLAILALLASADRRAEAGEEATAR